MKAERRKDLSRNVFQLFGLLMTKHMQQCNVSRQYHGISNIMVAMKRRVNCYSSIFNSSGKGCALYGADNPHRTSSST